MKGKVLLNSRGGQWCRLETTKVRNSPNEENSDTMDEPISKVQEMRNLQENPLGLWTWIIMPKKWARMSVILLG